MDAELNQTAASSIQGPVPIVHHWYEVDDFTRGVLWTLSVALLLAWLYWAWQAKQEQRRRQQQAVQLLRELDADTLRKILGETDLPSWVTFPDYERVGWLNAIICQLWPYVNGAATVMVRQQLGPLLRENKPPWMADLRLGEFTLGDEPPAIAGVKVYRGGAAPADELVLELEVAWAGRQEFQLTVYPLPRTMFGTSSVLTRLLSNLVVLRAGVRDVFFRGRLRVAMKHLMPRPPLVGAVKVAFVEPPTFSFGIDLYGGDISFLPGLELFITTLLRDTLLPRVTLPEGQYIPLAPDIDAHEAPAGILFVKLIEAANLPSSWMAKPRPRVALFVSGARRRRSSMAPIAHGAARWCEDFHFLVRDPDCQELVLVLEDEQVWLTTPELGRVVLPVKVLQPGETKDTWLALHPPSYYEHRRTAAAAADASTANGTVEAGAGDGGRGGDAGGAIVGQAGPTPGRPGRVHEALVKGRHGKPVMVHVQVTFLRVSTEDLANSAQPGSQRAAAGAGAAAASAAAQDHAAEDAEPGHEEPLLLPASSVDAQRLTAAAEAARAAQLAAGGEGRDGTATAGTSGRGAATPFGTPRATTPAASPRARPAAGGGRSSARSAAQCGVQDIQSMLRGGVLYARLHKHPPPTARDPLGAPRDAQAHLPDVPTTARQVCVRVAGQRKCTAEAKGEGDHVTALEDETLEFAVPGEVADDPDAIIDVEVWDYHWINADDEVLTWGPRGGQRQLMHEAHLRIPLREVIERRRLARTWHLPQAPDGQVDMELRWLPVLAEDESDPLQREE